MIAGLRMITLANEGRKLEGREVVRDIGLFSGFVRVIREIRAGRRSRPAMMIVVHLVSVIMDGMSDYLVTLALVSEQFLQSDDQADDEGNLADDESLNSDQSQSTKGNWDKGSSLKFQEKKDGQQGFNNLFLLTTS